MNKTITNNLRYLRKIFGKSQKEIAGAMGISPQAYSNIENRNRKVSAEELWLVSEYLNVDMSVFFNTELTESVTKEIQAI